MKISTAKTIYRTTKEYEKRPFEAVDEDGVSLWPPESSYKQVVSWPCFLLF